MGTTVDKSQRLGREDWLAAALEVLKSEGVGKVNIVRIARDLGVTSGSFYWHFSVRDELVERAALGGKVEVTLMPKEFEQFRGELKVDSILFFRGTVNRSREEPSIRGDEVIAPGAVPPEAMGPGQIYDANRPMLLAQVAAWGHEAVDLGHAPDSRDGLRETVDLVVVFPEE